MTASYNLSERGIKLINFVITWIINVIITFTKEHEHNNALPFLDILITKKRTIYMAGLKLYVLCSIHVQG